VEKPIAMGQRRRTMKSQWYLPLVYLLLLCALSAAALPTVLSLSFMKPFVENRLSRLLKGEVHIGTLHLSWLTSQSIEGFHYTSSDKKYSFTFKSLEISSSLFTYLITPYLNSLSHGTTTLLSPTLMIRESSAPLAAKDSSPSSLPLALLQNLVIQNGSFLTPSSTLHHINARICLAERSLSQLSVQGVSLAGNTPGQFSIEYTKGKSLFPEIFSISLEQFPIHCLDALVSKYAISSLIGDMATGHLTMKNSSLLSCSLTTDLVTFLAEAKISENAISLVKPSTLSWILTPKAFGTLKTSLSCIQPFTLTRNTSLQCTTHALTIPYDSASLRLDYISYLAKLETSLLALAEGEKPIAINAFSVSSSSSNLSTSVDFALHSSFNYTLKTPSSIDIEGSLSHPLQQNLAIDHLTIKTVKFPTALLDSYLSTALSPFIGESITMQVTKTSDNTGYKLQAHSPLLQIPETFLSLQNDSLTLASPTTLTYTASSLDKYLPIKTTSNLYATLESFQLFFSPKSLPITERLAFHLTLHSDDVLASLSGGSLALKNITLSLTEQMSKGLALQGSAHLVYSHEALKEEKWILSPMKLEIATHSKSLEKLNFSRVDIALYNSSNRVEAQIALQDKTLSFLTPITMKLTPNGEALTHWLGIQNPSLSLLFSPLQATVIASSLDLTRPLQEQLSLQAKLAIANVTITDKVFLREFTLQECNADVALHTSNHSLESSLQGKISSSQKAKGSFSVTFATDSYTSLAALQDNYHLSAAYNNLPSSLLDSLGGYKNVFSIIAGDLLQGVVAIVNDDTGLSMALQTEGPQIALAGAATLSSAAIQLDKPLQGTLRITPHFLDALEQILSRDFSNFKLQSPAIAQVKVDSFYWPKDQFVPLEFLSLKGLLDTLTHHLNKSYFHLTSRIDDLQIFAIPAQKATTITQCQLECSKPSPSSPVAFHINSSIGDTNQLGHLKATASLQASKDLQSNPVLVTKATANVEHFPTLFVDSFFQMLNLTRIPPSVLLGSEINANINMNLENLSGSVDVVLDATDSKGTINAYLTEGIVKLRKPIVATLNITPTLADFFLHTMNVSLSLAKNPLQLFISDQGFYFPLDNFAIKKVQIRQGSVNFGKILCENQGNPLQISGFFKLGQQKDQQLSLWFAPMDFTLSQGLLYIDRTEVLFNDAYQIAFWGNIDLIHNYVKMILGLTEQSLRKALGIRGLPKSFVLQIPMTGPIDNVQIDTNVATARITFLLAKASGLADQAGLWGDIVNVLGDFANDQSSVPPAKPPFPWKDALSRYELEEKRRLTNAIIR